MGTSLYYAADRAEPLTEEESAAIESVLTRYTIDPLIEYLGREERLEFRDTGYSPTCTGRITGW